jgi:OOP family OmpA-OmpF porin
MRYLLMHALLLIGGFTSAQNLVPNSSFEEYYVCPDNTSQVDSSVSWHSVLNTPDYFVTCSPYPVCIPDNLCGYQYPFDGNAYMGIITYDWYFTYWKEIIGTQLLDTLVPGNNYHFSMRVSRGNWTNQSYNCSASNNIGVRFTTKPYSASFPPPINNTATLNTDTIVKDTLNWILLSWNFTADSAYNYIYIGNFFDNAHTDTVVINAPNGHYLIV